MGKLIEGKFRKPPYYKRNPTDIMSSMWWQQMNSEQKGWFNTMMDRQWDSPNCLLVNSADTLPLYAGVNPNGGLIDVVVENGVKRERTEMERFTEMGWIVIQRFNPTPDGKYIFNARLLDEYEEFLGFRLECSKAGKKSAAKRRKHTSSLGQGTSKVGSTPVQGTCKQTETETETETELKAKAPGGAVATSPEKPAKSAAVPPKPKFRLPDWVPEGDWRDYEEMRGRIRKPMTDKAREWAIKKLDQLRTRGYPPAAVLQQSVFNAWQGLFELREHGNGTHQQQQRISPAEQRQQRIAATNRAILARFSGVPVAAGDEETAGVFPGGENPVLGDAGSHPPQIIEGSSGAVVSDKPIPTDRR